MKNFEIEWPEAVFIALQVFEFLLIGDRSQAAVEPVGPGVVGAGDALGAIAAGTIEKPCAAVPANVMEPPHLPVPAADHNQTLAEDIQGEIVAAVRILRLRGIFEVLETPGLRRTHIDGTDFTW